MRTRKSFLLQAKLVNDPTKTNAHPARSPELLNRHRSTLLVIDVQEKLLPVIDGAESITRNVSFLMDVASLLDVPVFVSEQYPQGLGNSVPEIANHKASKQTAEKIRFSAAECFRNSDTAQQAGGTNRQVVITGIEAHICVLQTAFDLISQGYRVFVVEDAVSSRDPADAESAIKRIRDAGGTVCVSESVAFEWCEQAGSDEFRAISRLVRNRMPGS